MKWSIVPAPLGLVMIGAALTGAAPAQAEGMPPPGSVEGVVTAVDPGATGPPTFTVHSAFDGDVVLSVDPNTHFRKAGGEQEPPLPLPAQGAPGAPTVAGNASSPAGFVGLFARATFDPNSHVAVNVFMAQPEPERFSGVVDSASATDLVLDVKGHGKLDLTLDPQTALRFDGLPATGDKLVQGDLADVLFWPAAGENEALRVDARTPPPQQFEGVLTGMATDTGGAVTGFTATRGSTPMTFQDGSSTQFWLDGKTATAADLKTGDMVHVSYRSSGGVNDALQVQASTPKPAPPVTHGSRRERHGSGGPNSGTPGTGTPGPTGNPNNEGGSPRTARPRVVGGQVAGVDATGNTFTLTHDGTTQTFTVDSNTTFQVNDKPAAFAGLQTGQQVYVVYQGTTSGNLALKVMIRQPTTPPAPTGTPA
jgi:Cu/Ag efflux protein CusF